MKRNLFKTLAAGCMTLLLSCSESILDEHPPHLISSQTLYTNLAGFEAGLNGMYTLVRHEMEGIFGTTGQVNNMFMNGTDNMTTNHYVNSFAIIAERWQDLNNPSDAFLRDIFTWLYMVVNSSNTIINQAEKPEIDWSGGGRSAEENKLRVIAEARAVRAWAYRHLTYCWGDVPLNLEESLGSTIRTDWTRTPVETVRKHVVTDLLFAEKHVGAEPSLAGRITKGAIQHYLGEMYLVLNKPDSALYWTDQAINTPNYRLVTARYGTKANEPGIPFMDMFMAGNSNREEGNTEALWVFQFALLTNGGGANNLRRDHHSRYVSIQINGVSPLQITEERGGRGYGRMSLTKWAIDNYEPADERGANFAIRKYFILKDAAANAPYPADRLPPGYKYGDTLWLNWRNDITSTARNRVDWPFSRKADWANPDNVGGDLSYKNQVYLRLAETYLLKAEAQFRLGNLAGAAETINVIRRRSKASEISAADVNLDFILDERSRELILEEHRRYTLLRTGKWLERTRKYNKNGGQLISERDVLFPIPQPVIDANLTQEMPQNPGFN